MKITFVILLLFTLVLFGNKIIESEIDVTTKMNNFELMVTGLLFATLILLSRVYPLEKIILVFFGSLGIGFLFCPLLGDEFTLFLSRGWVYGAPFFLWAFANNHLSFRQGGLIYPFIALFLLISIQIECKGWNYWVAAIATIISGLQLFARKLQHEEHPEGDEKEFGQLYRLLIGISALCVAWMWVPHPPAIPVLIASPLIYLWRGTSWISLSIAMGIAFFSSLFNSFTFPLFLVLKELSFIPVPKSIRFETKTWVDLFYGGIGSYLLTISAPPDILPYCILLTFPLVGIYIYRIQSLHSS